VVDFDDTSYYVDPASTSVMSQLDVRAQMYNDSASFVDVDDGVRANAFGVNDWRSDVGYYVQNKDRGVWVQSAVSYGIEAVGAAAGGYFQDSDSGVYAFVASGSFGIGSNGTKDFVQPHPTDPSKVIVYASLEGGEAGTYYRGSARLDHGTAVIELPAHFSLVTEEEGLTVQVTPREDCNGLYVAEVTTTSIVVKELQGGTSNVRFDFFINGIRAGYADYEVIREASEVVPQRASTPDIGTPSGGGPRE